MQYALLFAYAFLFVSPFLQPATVFDAIYFSKRKRKRSFLGRCVSLFDRYLTPVVTRHATYFGDLILRALPTSPKKSSKNKGKRGRVAYYCHAAGRSPQCVRFKRLRYGRIPTLIPFAVLRVIMLTAVVANSATSPSSERPPWQDHRYDSDSRLVHVDPCASTSITNQKGDMIGSLIPMRSHIKGIGGNVGKLFKGTIKWKIDDNRGQTHTVLLPNSIYCK